MEKTAKLTVPEKIAKAKELLKEVQNLLSEDPKQKFAMICVTLYPGANDEDGNETGEGQEIVVGHGKLVAYLYDYLVHGQTQSQGLNAIKLLNKMTEKLNS